VAPKAQENLRVRKQGMLLTGVGVGERERGAREELRDQDSRIPRSREKRMRRGSVLALSLMWRADRLLRGSARKRQTAGGGRVRNERAVGAFGKRWEGGGGGEPGISRWDRVNCGAL